MTSWEQRATWEAALKTRASSLAGEWLARPKPLPANGRALFGIDRMRRNEMLFLDPASVSIDFQGFKAHVAVNKGEEGADVSIRYSCSVNVRFGDLSQAVRVINLRQPEGVSRKAA